MKSYCAIHGVDESKNLGDITKVDKQALPKGVDIVTYGFPCQDISLAGKQKGFINADGSLTRSGLFFEALGIIEATKPKIAIAENVKNLTSKKFAEQFKIVLDSLEAAGYNNYWQVLNAKDYGIPQNRERVFIVSIRKDIDTGMFQFPEKIPLQLRLKDMLEDVVDEKYYLTNRRSDIIKTNLGNVFDKNFIIGSSQKNAFVGDGSVGPSLTSAMGNGGGQVPMIKEQIGCDLSINNPQIRNVANCIKARYDGGISNFRQDGTGVLVVQATKQGYAECEIGGVADLSFPNSKTRRGRVQEGGNICPTITAESNGVSRIETISYTRKHSPLKTDISVCLQAGYHKGFSNNNPYPAVVEDLRIRKLTPKECFRLMGFDDSDFEKAEAVNSNTQLYKQAGNSIVVDVLGHIFSNLFNAVPLLDINQN